VGPEDRQFPEFFVSQYGLLRRLRLEARHARRDRAEAPTWARSSRWQPGMARLRQDLERQLSDRADTRGTAP
jgi:hypothetical protein